jgi:hypothetical protein
MNVGLMRELLVQAKLVEHGGGTMRRLLISSAIGLGVLFGAMAPALVPTTASAYYYHHRYYPNAYYHHRHYSPDYRHYHHGNRPHYQHYHYGS